MKGISLIGHQMSQGTQFLYFDMNFLYVAVIFSLSYIIYLNSVRFDIFIFFYIIYIYILVM